MSVRWFMDVNQAGEVYIRSYVIEPPEGTLVLFSTDTKTQALELRTLFCNLLRDGSGLYQLNDWPGDYACEIGQTYRLELVAKFRGLMEKQYKIMKKRDKESKSF